MKKKLKRLTSIMIAVMLSVSTVLIPTEAASVVAQGGISKTISSVKAVSSKIETPVIRMLSTTQDSIGVIWNPVKEATGYIVYRKVNSSSWKKVKTITSNPVYVYYDRDVKVGYTYTYTVKAYKKINGKNIYSSYDRKGKSGKLTTVTKGFCPKEGTAEINWLKTEGASGYYVYRADGTSRKYRRIKTIKGGEVLSYTNSGLKDGIYYYKVTPYGTVNGKNIIGSSSDAKKIVINDDSVFDMPGIKKIDCWIYDTIYAADHLVHLPDIGMMGAEDITNSDTSVAHVSSMPGLLHIIPKKAGSTTITFTYGGKTWKSKINVSKWESPCKTFKVGRRDYSKYFEKASKYDLCGEKSVTSKVQIVPKSGWKLTKIERGHDGVSTPIKNGSNVNLSTAMTGTGIYAYFTNTVTKENKKLSFGYGDFEIPEFMNYHTESEIK